MRLDKFLKVSRLIKRRTVANEACDAARISVNGKPAKASYDVKLGDTIAIAFGSKLVTVKVLEIKDNGDTKTVVTDSGEFESKAVIIATGATHRLPGLDKELDYIGNGISFCAKLSDKQNNGVMVFQNPSSIFAVNSCSVYRVNPSTVTVFSRNTL